MKSGLNQATLAQMEFALTGQQALTEQYPGALQSAALGEIGLIRHQNVPHEIRMVHQIGVKRAQPEIRKVAVFLSSFAQKLNRPGAE